MTESTNKNIVKNIKKILSQNKKAWDSKLKYSLWVDHITSKNFIGASPFQLVYGTEAVFHVHLGLHVMKFMQDSLEEPNEVQWRIFQMIELQQERELLVEKAQDYKDKIKHNFDERVKENNFFPNDLVLRWDARRDEKPKHGNFDHLWLGPFRIVKSQDNNTYVLQNLEGDELVGPVNGRFLKHLYTK